MKRTIIALVTVITTTLIYQPTKKSVASDPIPSSLIGVWKNNGTNENDEKLYLYDDGSYSSKINIVTRPGGVYNQCATFVFRTTIGRFTVNENKIIFHLQTLSVNEYAACGLSFVTPTSLPKSYRYQNTYIVDSFSLQNNEQTLVLKQTGGNVNTATQGIYQKSSS